MSKFSSFSHRIFTLIVLFITPIITIIAIGSASVAFPSQTVAQRITSPGLTTPTAVPTPPAPVDEAPVIIPVPLPKNPLPGSSKPTNSSSPKFATNNANRVFSVGERDKIAAYLRGRNVNSSPAVNNLPDPRFILHDTSFIMSPSLLDRERRSGRGPLGLGVNAYLPGQDASVVARPNFYEARRPTTTEFEKASDILDRQDREQFLRQAWKSTNDVARRQALDTALANLDLSPAEIAAEKTGAIEKLSATSGRIFTTATWAVEGICSRYNKGDRSVAVPSQENSLSGACNPLGDYFNIRNTRVKSAELPNPPYSDNQYNSATSLYLRAALASGKFPQATTHFALDTFDPEAHCDPRCFNLTKLYNSIASVMGHARGSTYGITPSYGTQGGTNNIWWDDNICHGSAP
jgi:hypothetical protein